MLISHFLLEERDATIVEIRNGKDRDFQGNAWLEGAIFKLRDWSCENNSGISRHFLLSSKRPYKRSIQNVTLCPITLEKK